MRSCRGSIVGDCATASGYRDGGGSAGGEDDGNGDVGAVEVSVRVAEEKRCGEKLAWRKPVAVGEPAHAKHVSAGEPAQSKKHAPAVVIDDGAAAHDEDGGGDARAQEIPRSNGAGVGSYVYRNPQLPSLGEKQPSLGERQTRHSRDMGESEQMSSHHRKFKNRVGS